MRRNVLVALALTLWATTATGALNLISVNDEISLGRRAQEQVRRQVPVLRDRTVSAYIESLGRRIAARADGPRFPYSFDVANYREVNAFALPGGPIWINRGTIEIARTEAQLAGVIAHEVAHIANRHAAEQITKGTFANVGLGILGALIGGNGTGAQIAQLGAGVAAQATMMKFSRDDELLRVTSRPRGARPAAGAGGRSARRRPPELAELSTGAVTARSAGSGRVDAAVGHTPFPPPSGRADR
jgi:predicted Zn-dependent protease